MRTIKLSMLVIGLAVTLMSCENQMRDIPSGYVGKVLTPTGWQKGIHEAGQVNIGTVDNDGTGSNLVLLEATTTTVKEQFLAKGEDGEDHRVRTQDGTPLAVDMYVQIAVPTDLGARDGIFSMVTAKSAGANTRVSVITVEDIYNRFTHLAIRGSVRSIFAQYKTTDEVMKNYEKINGQIALSAIEAVKQSNAPFQILGAQLSNVKEDPAILASKNKLVGTDNEVQSIEKIGNAVRNNPGYLDARRLDVLEKAAANSKSNLVIMDSRGNTPVVIPVH